MANEESREGSTPTGSGSQRSRAKTARWWLLPCVSLAVGAGALVWSRLQAGPPGPPPVESVLALPRGVIPLTPTGVNLAISPDGSRVALVGISLDRSTSLWEWREGQATFTRLPDTGGARNPQYAPDGASLAFTQGRRLMWASLESEARPTVVADSVFGGPGIDWGDDGLLYFDRAGRGWWRVAPDGGAPEPVPGLQGPTIGLIDVLPGGAILYTQDLGPPLMDQLRVTLPGTDRSRLLDRGAMARYAPTGHVLYTVGNELVARRFDPDAAHFSGPSVSVVTSVHVDPSSNSYFAVSRGARSGGTGSHGSLVYLTAGALPEHASELVWVDRRGTESPLDPEVPPRPFTTLALSPDQLRLAVTIATEAGAALCVINLPGGRTERLTPDLADRYPAWSPDGESLAYISNRRGRAEARLLRSDGSAPGLPVQLVRSGRQVLGVTFTPDLRHLVLAEGSAAAADLTIMDVASGERRMLVATDDDETAPAVSPDGRWVAYVSNESGRDEVFVRPFASGAAAATRVSDAGGTEPLWAHDGEELFFREPSTGEMMAAAVASDARLAVGEREELFDATPYRTEPDWRAYDVGMLDDRFLMMRPTADAEPATEVRLIRNFFTRLEADVPARGPGAPRSFWLVFLGGLSAMAIGLGYDLNRRAYGLRRMTALAEGLKAWALMASLALLWWPLFVVTEQDRELVASVISGCGVAVAAYLWLRARKRIAGAGATILEVPDVATRRLATVGTFCGVVGALASALDYADPIFNETVEKVGAVVIGLGIALLGLRARSAVVAFRERGIARESGLTEWERIERFSWSPDAEATVRLTLSSSFPMPGALRLRVPPEARAAVSEILAERVPKLAPASPAPTPSAGARAEA